jgi:hypothetical protein
MTAASGAIHDSEMVRRRRLGRRDDTSSDASAVDRWLSRPCEGPRPG